MRCDFRVRFSLYLLIDGVSDFRRLSSGSHTTELVSILLQYTVNRKVPFLAVYRLRGRRSSSPPPLFPRPARSLHTGFFPLAVHRRRRRPCPRPRPPRAPTVR